MARFEFRFGLSFVFSTPLLESLVKGGKTFGENALGRVFPIKESLILG